MDFEKIIEKIIEFCMSAGVKLIISALILIIGFKLIKVLTKSAKNKSMHMDKSVKSFMLSFLNIALKAMLVIIVASYLGVPMTSVITLLGSAGIAVGLSLQGSLANLAGGIIIMTFKPFSVGDFISAGSYDGTVSEIGIFYTKLVTSDNRVVVIPNGTISNQSVVNTSAKADRRVDIKFTAAYWADTEEVKGVLLSVAAQNEKIYAEPSPSASVSAHLDSAVEYSLKVWCKREDYWNVHGYLMSEVKRAFDRNDIEIPYPHIDVNVNK